MLKFCDSNPLFSEEKKLWKRGYKCVVGLDEAGRGPLAGSVTAAAVTLPAKSQIPNPKSQSLNLKGIKDSKKLSLRKREEFYEILTQHPDIQWAAASVSPKVIDRINIQNAAELAMERAVQKLEKKYSPADFLIIDGNRLKNYKLQTKNYKLLIKADETVFSCMAASIIAKVTRDRMMMRLHKKYPEYRFDIHKGYPTKLHKSLLKKSGPCEIHRKTFAPIKRS